MKFSNLNKFKTGGLGSKMTLSIPLPKTPDGRVYRYSPNENAHPRHFLLGDAVAEPSTDEVHVSRMKQPPRSPNTTCPYSGSVAKDSDFTHPDDIEAAKKIVMHEAQKDLNASLNDMANQFNRKQKKGGLISMSMSTKSTPKIRPRFYRRDLMRELVCDHCNRDYAVFALSLYCPDCGAPNVALHFARERELATSQVELAERLDNQDELAYRLLGNAHEDVLTAFEATLKSVYLHRAQAENASSELPKVGNAFQNIEKSQKRFKEWGFDPFAVLQDDDLAALALDIQKRHVIGHNLSVADEKFVQQAAEAKVGETVAIVGQDVIHFADACYLVVKNVDDWLAGLETPITPDREVQVASMPGTKSLDAQIAEDTELSEVAVQVARHFCETSKTGMPDMVQGQDISAHFSDLDSEVLSEALSELELDGFLTIHKTLGRGIPSIRLETELFASFDPLLTEYDPHRDAAQLAKLVIESNDSGNVEDLHVLSEWSLRRFNPAIAIMLLEIDDRRISKAGYGKYPTRHFALMAEDRVRLKRLAKRTSGN